MGQLDFQCPRANGLEQRSAKKEILNVLEVHRMGRLPILSTLGTLPRADEEAQNLGVGARIVGPGGGS